MGTRAYEDGSEQAAPGLRTDDGGGGRQSAAARCTDSSRRDARGCPWALPSIPALIAVSAFAFGLGSTALQSLAYHDY